MRVFIILCCFFLFIDYNANSQIKFGITAGPNFPYQHIKTTSPSGNVETTRDMIVSFNTGIASDFKLAKKINVQPVLQFSGKGSTFSYMIGGSNEEINVRTYYIELLLPIQYNFSLRSNRVFLGAGSSLSYGISGKEKSPLQAEYDPFEHYMKRFDAGVLLQTGVKIGNLQLMAQYNHGIANIYKNEYPYVMNEAKISFRNRVFSLSGVYFFHLN